MSVKRGGLGRNLSALLSSNVTSEAHSTPTKLEVTHLDVHQLQPGKYQPRTDLDDNGLHELAESIKKQGLMQPIIVRALAPTLYEIIAGERRWRASQIAGLTEIPALIHQVDDETAMAMALVENLQREDLNVIDQARAMQRLIQEFNLTHHQIAELLSKSRATVSNHLRLLQLNPAVMRLLECNDLDMGHARCLLGLDSREQTQVAHIIVAKNLSVREAEALVARFKAGKTETKPTQPPIRFETLLNSLNATLQTPVKLTANKKGQGKLIIHYKNEVILEKMLAHLGTLQND